MELTKEQKKVIKQADVIEKAFEKILDLGGHMVVNIDGEVYDIIGMARGEENYNVKFGPNEFIIILP